MNLSDLILAALVLAGLASWSVVLWRVGVQRGRDEQRVADILELWRAAPDRDARGRFKSKAKQL